MQRTALEHKKAIFLMLLCTLMWSSAGVFTRYIHNTPGFEIAMWRSIFAALTVPVFLRFTTGHSGFSSLRNGGKTLWLSALCWAVMFSCFMIALSLTTVANVLITQSLAPVFTALLSWLIFKRRIAPRLWLTIFLVSCGITLMYMFDVAGHGIKHLLGVLIAIGIPVAAAINFVLLQHKALNNALQNQNPVDFTTAVLIGGALSALAMLPLALPLYVNPHDLLLLAFLGVVQLGIPCVLMVQAARHLAAPETALLALLEVIFGMVWAWLFAGEQPGPFTLVGGSLVIGALAWNEWRGLKTSLNAS